MLPAKYSEGKAQEPAWKNWSLETVQYWMREAFMVADKALPRDVPVGALIFDSNGNKLAEGFNTREQKQTCLGHAELNAMTMACQKLGSWRLEGCLLVVTLEPCPMCAGALHQAQISRVIYGAADTLYGAAGTVYQLLDTNRTAIQGGVLEAEAQERLKQFFKGLRQTRAVDKQA